MEMLELAKPEQIVSRESGCPFDHENAHQSAPNDWQGDSEELGKRLTHEPKSAALVQRAHNSAASAPTISMDMRRSEPSDPVAQDDLTYNAHHILPAGASWPQAQALKKWMDAGSGFVIADIGYDVNATSNGIFLPSAKAKVGAWRTGTENRLAFRKHYAFSAMEALGKDKRQFHDAHNKHTGYSNFVVRCLLKIAGTLETLEGRPEGVGCENDKCPGRGMTKKRYPVPFGLLKRIENTSKRIEARLHGDHKKWVAPLFTSKFAVMYKLRATSPDLTEDEAVQMRRQWAEAQRKALEGEGA